GFHHHYGVIHNNPDGQHEREEGKQVYGESKYLEEEERTDNRHWHRYRRDESRTEVLQEEIHNDEHQYERYNERLLHLVDRLVEEFLRAEHCEVVNTAGERLSRFLHHLLCFNEDVIRIGAWRLEKRYADTWPALNKRVSTVGKRSELDARNILESNSGTVR